MKSIENGRIEATLHCIAAEDGRLLSLHCEDVLHDRVELLHRLLLFLQPFLAVLLVGEAEEEVEEEVDVRLLRHIE